MVSQNRWCNVLCLLCVSGWTICLVTRVCIYLSLSQVFQVFDLNLHCCLSICCDMLFCLSMSLVTKKFMSSFISFRFSRNCLPVQVVHPCCRIFNGLCFAFRDSRSHQTFIHVCHIICAFKSFFFFKLAPGEGGSP